MSLNERSSVKNYWSNRSHNFLAKTCPNVAFFRLLNRYFVDLNGLNALEVGFGDGADLRELYRRGVNTFGLDMVENYVERLKSELGCAARVFDASCDKIPFIQKFDIIFSLDMVYYLDSDGLRNFFKECAFALSKKGILVIQIIEADYVAPKTTVGKPLLASNLNGLTKRNFFEHDNPIQLYPVEHYVDIANENHLSLIGGKLILESYDECEQNIRQNRYLVFKNKVTSNV